MTARFAAHNPPDVFYVDSSVAADVGEAEACSSRSTRYIKASKYDTSKFYPGLLNAFKFGKTIYGFPKDWSPLATEINKSMFAKAGIRKVAADVGPAHRRRAEARVVERGAGRQADLPPCRLGADARVRLPEQGLAREGAVRRRDDGRELLRRPAQAGPGGDADAARRGLARRGARQGEGRDHLRGQLAAAVHEVDTSRR